MPGTKRLNLKLTKVKFAFELPFNQIKYQLIYGTISLGQQPSLLYIPTVGKYRARGLFYGILREWKRVFMILLLFNQRFLNCWPTTFLFVAVHYLSRRQIFKSDERHMIIWLYLIIISCVAEGQRQYSLLLQICLYNINSAAEFKQGCWPLHF